MKILCLISGLGSGGAERQMTGLANLLQEKGDDIKLIYYHKLHFYRDYLERNSINNECVVESKYKLVNLYFVYKKIKTFNPDVVISYMDGPSLIACIIKILGMSFKLLVSERTSTVCLRRTLKKKIKFALYRVANCVVPNSYSEADYLKVKYPFLKGKIFPITNFVDLDYFYFKERRNNLTITNILVVGRIIVSKNVLNLIYAIRNLLEKGFVLNVTWVGKIENITYYKQCLNECHRLNLDDYILFKGESVSIIEDYHNADVFCLPSWREGFPNVICEAMACGLPILCSDIGDNSHIVISEKNGFLFNPYSVSDIENTLSRFLEMNVSERQKMGEASREIAMERFSKKRFIEQYSYLINSNEY